MNLMRILYEMDIKSLNIKEIKSISVRITCKHGDMKPKTGTGTLISDGVSFFVMTAAHCICYKVKDENGEERTIPYGIDEIVVESFAGGTAIPITLLGVMDWNPDDDKDYALLCVEKPKIDFDFSKVVRLGKPDVNNSQLFGFFSIRPKGHLYNLEIVDEDSWIVKGVKEKQEEPETVLPGISGGGLLFKSEDTYYCLGYVKREKDKEGHFDEVVVYPMSHFNILGESTWRESLYMPSVPIKEKMEVVANDGQYDTTAYNVIWRKISGAVWNKEDISHLFEELCEERAKRIIPKYADYQRQTVRCLIRKKEDWNEQEKLLFAIAVEESGGLPILYAEIVKDKGMEKCPLWLRLMQRQNTLDCNFDGEEIAPDETTNEGVYELLLRDMFAFNFNAMQRRLDGWHPSVGWVSKKVLLLCMLNRENGLKYLEDLGKVIDTEELPIEQKFIATNIYNVIDPNFKKKYDYKEYWNAGVDGTTDVLNYISDNIDKKKNTINPYGTHTETIIGGGDSLSFPEALRLLQYIINTGITTEYGFTYFIEKERWFKVARQLFRFLPYPILFYTFLYNDEKLSRRLGQEMAYTDDDDFMTELPNIMIHLLDVVHQKNAPHFFSGLYSLIQELYIAVDENVWLDKFKKGIFGIFLEEEYLEKRSSSDPIYKNVCKALSCLRNDGHIKDVFLVLMGVRHKNEALIYRLICEALHLNREMLKDDAIKYAIDDMVRNEKLASDYLLLLKLKEEGMLSDEQLSIIDKKAMDEGLDFANNSNDVILQLAVLLENSKSISVVKKMILEKDMWKCGISDKRVTMPNPIYLGSNGLKINWTDEESKKLMNNMRLNLELIRGNYSDKSYFMAFANGYAFLLIDMIQFVKAGRYEEKGKFKEIIDLLSEVSGQVIGTESVMNGLVQEEARSLVAALLLLQTYIEYDGIEKHLDDVGFMIDRILLKKKKSLQDMISVLKELMTLYSDKLIEHFGDKLILLLESYCDYDYEDLELDVPKTNRCLHLIAERMQEKYGSERTIAYWIENEKVNRYVTD